MNEIVPNLSVIYQMRAQTLSIIKTCTIFYPMAIMNFNVKWKLNPCPAELLQLYFSSFEAGIANAISSFK